MTRGARPSAWARRARIGTRRRGGGLPAKPRAGAEPDRPARRDYEYGRSGTANLFLWVEPLAGRLDSAHQLKALTDEHHAEAEVVVLVTDNW